MRAKMKTNEKNITVCRCEDLNLAEIESAIDSGFTNFEELRRYLRIGMGPCQGRTCLPLVRTILARKLGENVSNIPFPTRRPPAVNVPFGSILDGVEKSCH